MIKKLLLIILLSSLSGLAMASGVEHDYRAALNSALKNRLEDAEKQFADILSQNPGHSRASDALYWLARVQFMKGDFRGAAGSYQRFITQFQKDSRISDVELYFAEAVSNYAEPERACEIYSSLITELFLNSDVRMHELVQLSKKSGCKSGEIAKLADYVEEKTAAKQKAAAEREKELTQSTIPGAFGMRLGQTFSGKEITLQYDSGEAAYAFEPQNPNESFTHYGVLVTPVTQTVYKIVAANLDGKGCETERKVIEILLDKKYIAIKEDESLSDHSNYSLGSRRISLFCAWGGQLTLNYIDKELEKLNVREIASKQNGSGF